MALGGLGALLLAGHPTYALGHVFSKLDLRSIFFAVVFVIIVLVLAYLTNPSEASFRTHLTELHIKEHIRQLEGAHDDSSPSSDANTHFTLSRRSSHSTRKPGSNFDPQSPFHFVSRASVSLRTPKHVFHNLGILSIAAVYPLSRYGSQGTEAENLSPSVLDAWYIGMFGTWWRGGVIQSRWHELWEGKQDAERCGSGLLNIKALDALEGFDGLPLPTSSRPPCEAPGKLKGTERSMQRSTSNVPRSTTPPPLPKSASLPLHAPRVAASSTPPKANGSPNRHAPTTSLTSAPVTPEPSRPPAPPVIAYSPSSTSLWDSSPIIAEVLRQISQSKTAVQELRTQLADFHTSASEAHATIETELEAQRERKREEDGARTELKTRTKTLEDSKRSAESSKRDAEKRLRAAENARDNATARIEKLGEEIGALRCRMRDDEAAVVSCKEEGDVKEEEVKETLERKKKEIKVAEEVVAALNVRAKELEERIVQAEEGLRRAKEQAEIKKQDRSFYPLTVVPTVEEDIAIPAWSSYASQNQTQEASQDSFTHHSDELLERQEVFPHPIQAPKSKGSISSGSGSSDTREPSVSPRPARLSLTSISNLRGAATRVLSEPDPNGQVLLRPRGFPLFADLPSNISTQSTSTRFSPFESDEGIEPSSADPPTSASSISPSSYIPSGLINSLDGTGGFDIDLSRSFQSEDDAPLARDWRKKTAFPRPLPVESPGTGMGMYTTSPASLTYPSFEGVDKEDPFEVRPQPARRRFTTEPMDLQRATLLSNRTISDPAPVPMSLAEDDAQDKTALAHRRWSSRSPHDAIGKERKGLNPEAKAFSLTKRSFPCFLSPPPQAFDPLAPHASSLSLPASLAPDQDTNHGHLFSSISMRAFAPSPAEREALKRALGGSTNTSLERLPTLSEVSSVSSIPSLSLPSSPSHSHAVAVASPPGLRPSLGAGAAKDAGVAGFGFGNGRTILGPGIAWLQSLPRVRKSKFSPWEDEETKELEAGGARGQ